MEELFANLANGVSGTPVIAFGASMLWGVLSIILSPCHLASIPLIVGFVNEQGRTSTRRAFQISLMFSLGILITIAVIGGLTAMAGRLLGDIGKIGNYLVSIIFFLVGLHMLDVIPMPLQGPNGTALKRKGVLAAFMLGLIFGLALGPCTFAFMAPMLGITFKVGAERPLYAAMLLLMYGVGHCSVIILAGTFTEWIQKYLNWNEQSKGAVTLKKVCGVLVILAGIYLIYTV